MRRESGPMGEHDGTGGGGNEGDAVEFSVLRGLDYSRRTSYQSRDETATPHLPPTHLPYGNQQTGIVNEMGFRKEMSIIYCSSRGLYYSSVYLNKSVHFRFQNASESYTRWFLSCACSKDIINSRKTIAGAIIGLLVVFLLFEEEYWRSTFDSILLE